MQSTPIGVLLVEDDHFQSEALADLLGLEGFDVFRAGDAADAMIAIEANKDRIHLGVLDIDLPGQTNGIELLRWIRDLWPTIELVILSGQATLDHAVAALNLGACYFHFKPCEPKHLVQTLNAAYERKVLLERNDVLLRQLVEARNASYAADLGEAGPAGDLSAFTHELRNQLTVLQGNAELSSYDSALCLSSRERFKDIVEVCVRITGIIARQRSGGAVAPAALERLDLAVFGREVLDQVRYYFSQRRVVSSLVADGGPLEVMADPARLGQVFINLFINAAEAMPEGGVVAVAVTRAATEAGDQIWFSVRDTGPGLQPEVLARLFAKGCTSKPASRGLGLYLLRAMVTAHGGTVEAANRQKGAEFTVKLPAAP